MGGTHSTRSRCGAPWVPLTTSGTTRVLARAHPPQEGFSGAEVHVREAEEHHLEHLCPRSPAPQTAFRGSLSTRAGMLPTDTAFLDHQLFRHQIPRHIYTQQRISTHATHTRGQPLGADPTGVTALASPACLSWSERRKQKSTIWHSYSRALRKRVLQHHRGLG